MTDRRRDSMFAEPTPRQLRSVLSDPNPPEPATFYEGGFSLRHPDGQTQGHVSVTSRFGDLDLVLQASAGRASASAVAGLQPDEVDQLIRDLQRGVAAQRAARAERGDV